VWVCGHTSYPLFENHEKAEKARSHIEDASDLRCHDGFLISLVIHHVLRDEIKLTWNLLGFGHV
jgi:hypothetical protein